MALPQCKSLPLHPSTVSPANFSSEKHNLKPRFKFRATKGWNVRFKDSTRSKQLKPPNHVISIAGNANPSSFVVGTKDAIDECLYLLNQYNRDSGRVSNVRQIHARVVKLGVIHSNSAIGSKLTTLYSRNLSLLDEARKLFDEIPERMVQSYAALIGSYCRSRRWGDLISLFGLMVSEDVQPDKFLVPTILKACSVLEILGIGKMLHGYVMRKNLESDVFVGNALIDMYANCGDLLSSRRVFDLMAERDVVSWTALVSAYMDAGLSDEAMSIFQNMQLNGVKPDLISWNALLSGFSRSGEADIALQLLEEMKEKGVKPLVNSWNGIISGFVQNGYFELALDVYGQMLQFSEDSNAVTIASILQACAGLKDLDLGKAVHGYACKHELKGNSFVGGSLIDMYLECGMNNCTERVFVEIDEKNIVLWNKMIAAHVTKGEMTKVSDLFHLMHSEGFKPDVVTYNTVLSGYARNGQKTLAFELLLEMVQMGLKPNIVSLNVIISGFQQSGLSGEALKLFRVMQSPSSMIRIFTDFSKVNNNFPLESLNESFQPNPVTTTGALAACADLSLWRQGKEIHGYIIRKAFEPNIYISSSLVDMYAKCHDMDSASKVFWMVEDRNTISWNVLLAGHRNNNQPKEALKLFNEMLKDGLAPSSITLVILLSACSDITALRLGTALHGYIAKSEVDEYNITLAAALVDMYAKCGSIKDARLVFNSEVEKDLALWNAMLSGYSVHGMTRDAIALFEQMELSGLQPDHITFTALLSACSHEGLVEDGWKYFNDMQVLYGIKPSLEHYTCMVGIMGGAALLEEALDFIEKMPHVPDACMWATLLRACRVHSNVKLGERAANALFELEPSNITNYILLSNIYAMAGMWDSARDLKIVMSSRGLMTTKECSSINIGTTIHTFSGGESSHDELQKIMEMWNKLASQMKHAGHFPLDPVFEGKDVIDIFSCLHTEKLAVCFGIISSSAHYPVRISKNIRMCVDCHTSMKYISKIDERDIYVKDGCFYHQFRDGICSCRDRW